MPLPKTPKVKVPPLSIAAPDVMTRSSITDLANRVRQSEGQYGAQRVERAADEIPNLEKLYQDQALMRAFTGDNAQALMTMKPSDFERYAAPLDANLSDRSLQKIADITGFHNNGGFSDVPYLNINKMQQGSTGLPYISGHEGRHRNRVMDAAGEQAGLVQLVPRSELREPFPRRSKEEYLEALYKEMQLTGNRVKPEAYYLDPRDDKTYQRRAIELPNFYAQGGIVDSAPEEAIKNTVRDPQAYKMLDMDLANLALMNQQPQHMAGGGAVHMQHGGKPDEDLFALKPQPKPAVPTVRDLVAQIGKNPARYEAKYPAKDFTPFEMQAYRLMQAAKQTPNANRYLESLSPYFDSQLKFDIGAGSDAGYVEPKVPNLAVIQQLHDVKNTIPHELTHTVQLGKGAGVDLEGDRQMMQRAQALPVEMQNTMMPSGNRFENMKETWANINARAHEVNAAGGDFINSPEGRALFPTPELQREYYTKAMPGVNSLTPDTGTFVPNKAHGGAVRHFDEGGEVSQSDLDRMKFELAQQQHPTSPVMQATPRSPIQDFIGTAGGYMDKAGRFVSEALEPIAESHPVHNYLGNMILAAPLKSAGTALQDYTGTVRETDEENPVRGLISKDWRNLNTSREPMLDPRVLDIAQFAAPVVSGATKLLGAGAKAAAPFATKIDDMVRELHTSGAMPQPGLSIKDVTPRVTAAQRAAAGRAAAKLIESQPQQKLSEALGNQNLEGFGELVQTQADRTRVGGGNIGGAPFSAISAVDPAYAGKSWGVMDEGTASRLKNLTSPSTVWTTMLGSANQLRTNPKVFDKLEKEFKSSMAAGKLSPELEAKINQNLSLPMFMGEGAEIRDPNIWKNLDTFEKRAMMADLMMGQGLDPKKGGIALGGEKSGKGVIFRPSDILIRETEPSLLHPEHGGNAPTFSIGPRLFTIENESSYRPDLHPGFPTLLHGKDLGVNYAPVPTEIALPDWHARFKAANPDRYPSASKTKGPFGPGYYDLALGVKGEGLPSQKIDEKYLTWLQKHGNKKGGKVSIDAMRHELTRSK
jgi:hypothetical protein